MISKNLNESYTRVNVSVMVSRMNFLVLSITILLLCHTVNKDKPKRYNIGSIQRFENIIKSPYDTRQYRGLILENELKVLLISDPTTDRSAASLTVSAGYLNEDEDLPGIAHFLEHMLFLGSKKYPLENEYVKFVSEHSGSWNAYTVEDTTNYYFDISPNYLVPALDRFAQFFVEPLMDESATHREVMAVNSEYELNVSEDAWHIYQLEKSMSKPGHPYNKFTIGNLETLELRPKSQGISVRDKLLEFHSKWYSANLMNLAVFGKESLDELEEIVIKLFGEVKNRHVQRIVYDDHPYGPDQMKRKFFVVPIQDVRILKISFSTPDVSDQYKTLPQGYLSHLINHEGPGSVHSLLREKELCNNLVAELIDTAPGFTFFNIAVDLTEKAIDRVDEIITIILQYIKLLKTEGIQKWIFEEYKRIKELRFLFKDKSTPISDVTWFSSLMPNFPFEDILTVYYVVDKWEPRYIENLLFHLIPDNMRVVIESKSFEKITNQTERWFGAKYKVEQIPDDLIQKWKEVELSENLHLPCLNEFIPQNFDLYPRSENEPKNPYVLHESSLSRIWFKHDDEFKRPKLNLQFEILSPVSSLDPFNRNITEMFVLLLKDSLNQYSYDAYLTELTWNIVTVENGIWLALSGFHEKLPILLKKILSEMTHFKFDKKRFEILKESYVRTLKNFETEQPYLNASIYLIDLLSERGWTTSDLLDATIVLEYSNFEKFAPQLFSKIFINGLIHGNCNKQKAVEIVNMLETSLKSSFELFSQQLLPSRQVKIENGYHLSYEIFNNYHSSSCHYVYFQCSTEPTLNNTIIELFAQIVEEPCFSTLRTQEQLGYVVESFIQKFGGVQGFVVRIQSEKHPLYLNYRVEEFFHSIHKTLQNMTDEELEVHKTSLVINKLKKPERLSQRTRKYWTEISSQMYNFNRDEIEVKELEKLGKKDILNFFEEFLQEGAPKRRKLSVNIISKVTDPKRPTNIPDKDIIIEDIIRFKSSSSLFPLPDPYMKILLLGKKPKKNSENSSDVNAGGPG